MLTNIIAIIIAFAVAGASGLFIIPMMRKLHFGATIYEEGPAWQKSKNGTPLMGGFMFILGILVSAAVCIGIYRYQHSDVSLTPDNTSFYKVLSGIAFALFNGGIGFVDDYIKSVKKDREGLKPGQKMVAQFIGSALFLAALYLLGDTSTAVHFPFIGDLELWYFYYPLMMLYLVYLTNAVNLTDGVDGLCGSVTVVFAACMLAVFSRMGEGEAAVWAAALAGGCMGFLIWNINPAKIFMGDTGSMFLGGTVCAMGFIFHQHVMLVLAAILYIAEALSVVLQVTYFKITKKKYGEGRRIFKMTPIHHHFEMSGFSENKIVIVFSCIALAGGIAANLMLNH